MKARGRFDRPARAVPALHEREPDPRPVLGGANGGAGGLGRARDGTEHALDRAPGLRDPRHRPARTIPPHRQHHAGTVPVDDRADRRAPPIDTHDTPSRNLRIDPTGVVVRSMVHRDPSHRSASRLPGCPSGPPTAMHASGAVRETPRSTMLVTPAGAGCRWIDQIAAPARSAPTRDNEWAIYATAKPPAICAAPARGGGTTAPTQR